MPRDGPALSIVPRSLHYVYVKRTLDRRVCFEAPFLQRVRTPALYIRRLLNHDSAHTARGLARLAVLAAVEDVAGAARAVREQLHDVLERRLVLELGALLRDGLRLRLLDTVALGGVWVRVRSWDLISKMKVFGYI